MFLFQGFFFLFWGKVKNLGSVAARPTSCTPPSAPLPISCPFTWHGSDAHARPGLTGQRVDALGELVLLPGASFELAAEHVTIVLLLHRPRLGWLGIRGRLWGFLDWGYGITPVTIHPSPEAQAGDAERGRATADPGTGAEGTLALSHDWLQALCTDTRVNPTAPSLTVT